MAAVLIDHAIELTPPTSEGLEKVVATATEESGWVAPHPAAKMACGLWAAKPVSGCVVVVEALPPWVVDDEPDELEHPEASAATTATTTAMPT